MWERKDLTCSLICFWVFWQSQLFEASQLLADTKFHNTTHIKNKKLGLIQN